jgi:hypothetical protein
VDLKPDPGGQKLPTEIEKSLENSLFFGIVLFWGLKASSVV